MVQTALPSVAFAALLPKARDPQIPTDSLAMALRLVLVLLVVTIQGSQAKNETTATTPAALGNLIHCPCGAKCQKDLGKWHTFDVGQSCMCQACSQGNLRGSEPKQAEPLTAPPAEAKQAEAELLDWDSGVMPSNSLLYCRCGTNLWGTGCRPCQDPCRCGRDCVDWVQGPWGGSWCVEYRCRQC